MCTYLLLTLKYVLSFRSGRVFSKAINKMKLTLLISWSSNKTYRTSKIFLFKIKLSTMKRSELPNYHKTADILRLHVLKIYEIKKLHYIHSILRVYLPKTRENYPERLDLLYGYKQKTTSLWYTTALCFQITHLNTRACHKSSFFHQRMSSFVVVKWEAVNLNKAKWSACFALIVCILNGYSDPQIWLGSIWLGKNTHLLIWFYFDFHVYLISSRKLSNFTKCLLIQKLHYLLG